VIQEIQGIHSLPSLLLLLVFQEIRLVRLILVDQLVLLVLGTPMHPGVLVDLADQVFRLVLEVQLVPVNP